MAALNVKDPEVHDLAVELARRTNTSLTQAVKASLRESVARDRDRVVDRVMRLAARIASRPVLDPRTPDQILGYDDAGVPD